MAAPLRLSVLIAAALLLGMCGAPSPPRCQSVPKASRGDASLILDEARAAWRDLSTRSTIGARARYNVAVAKLVDHLRCGGDSPEERAAAIGTRIDRSRTLGTGLRLEDLDALVPAAAVDTEKVGTRHLDRGLGVPLVGWKSEGPNGERRFDFAPPTGLPLMLTAILDFDTSPPAWRLLYPGRVDEVAVGGRRERLAADWSAAGAFYWNMSDLDDVDLAKVFLPSRFTEQTRLYLTSPYDPDKIPVVFVHGLKSSPGAFRVMFNELLGEAWFRENYQAWFFNYPTGTSWLFNAAHFRDELRRASALARSRGGPRTWNRMVLVGHSMGGVISHASLVDPGSRFYDAYFDKPPEELRVSRTTREAIRHVTLYEPVQAPSRVIFMAAPHRGSPLADRFFSQWASNLIRLPKTMTVDLLDVTLSEFGGALAAGGNTRPLETSIGTLSPSYRGYEALNDSPYRSGLKRHSIIGDRGRGDSPDSSDGVVPYWSSHFKPVDSERIVPCDHSVCEHPETISEVERILRLHLQG